MKATHAPASPWRPRPDAAPLRAWPADGPARVAQLLQAAWQAWARDWGVGDAGEGAVMCDDAAAARAPGEAWDGLGRGPHGAAWTYAAPDAEVQLARALFAAEDAGTPVVREVIAACRADAHARLAGALQLSPRAGESAPPPAATWRPWSGALLASLPLGVRVLLAAELVRSLLPPPARETARAPAPLVPLHRAAAALTLPLQVRLDACEVDVGSLQDLRPGDVVRLPHPLDAPAAVVGRDGRLLFGGYLIRRRGRKAIELARPGAAATVTVEEGTP